MNLIKSVKDDLAFACCVVYSLLGTENNMNGMQALGKKIHKHVIAIPTQKTYYLDRSRKEKKPTSPQTIQTHVFWNVAT